MPSRARVRALCASLPLLAVLFLVAVEPVAAQSGESDCSCRPFWQIVAAALLGAFIAIVVMLLMTRWRRLIDGRDHGA